MPLNKSELIDFYIVNVRSRNQLGKIVFTISVLI